MSSNNTADNGVRELVRVNGVDIDLEDVSPGLRRQYHYASRQAGKHANAKAELQAIGEAMLAEAFPKMAMKAAMRNPISGHSAVSHLMGFKKKA
jgi:hypothetical protein